MKYITLIIGLLVVGCGKTAEEKVVGTYEWKKGEDTFKLVLLENGIGEDYENGKKREEEAKWKISKDGELHIVDENGDSHIIRINKDGSITVIARTYNDEKREAIPKEEQWTLKKIK